MAPTLDFTQFRAEDGSNTKHRIQGYYTGPASYTTGGDPLAPGDLKLGQVDVLLFETAYRASDGAIRLLRWHFGTSANGNANAVTWYDPTTGAQIAAAVDLSGFVAKFEAIGR